MPIISETPVKALKDRYGDPENLDAQGQGPKLFETFSCSWQIGGDYGLNTIQLVAGMKEITLNYIDQSKVDLASKEKAQLKKEKEDQRKKRELMDQRAF